MTVKFSPGGGRHLPPQAVARLLEPRARRDAADDCALGQVDAPVRALRGDRVGLRARRPPLARDARPRRLARPARPGDQVRRVQLPRHARAQHEALLRRQPDEQDVRVLLGARVRRTCRAPDGARRAALPLPDAQGRRPRRRKFEMVFHFTPEESCCRSRTGASRSHPELKIDVPFLLVGTILEPGVSLDRRGTTSAPLLIGQGARETLHIVNTEHLPFSFAFEKSSFATGPGGGESVVNDRADDSGVVGPDSSLPIELVFNSVAREALQLQHRAARAQQAAAARPQRQG